MSFEFYGGGGKMPTPWRRIGQVYQEKKSLRGGGAVFIVSKDAGAFEWRLSDATSATGYSVRAISHHISGWRTPREVRPQLRPRLRPSPRKKRCRRLLPSMRVFPGRGGNA